jgi:hypothetical protein
MNKLIKELAMKADPEYTGDEDDNIGHALVGKAAIQRFAELLLQDIDKIVTDLYHNLPLEQAVVLLTLDENIKEHFYRIE